MPLRSLAFPPFAQPQSPRAGALRPQTAAREANAHVIASIAHSLVSFQASPHALLSLQIAGQLRGAILHTVTAIRFDLSGP